MALLGGGLALAVAFALALALCMCGGGLAGCLLVAIPTSRRATKQKKNRNVLAASKGSLVYAVPSPA